MFTFLKQLFCKHDLEITRTPIIIKRFEMDDDWEIGKLVSVERTEVNVRCKKCGWHSYDLE